MRILVLAVVLASFDFAQDRPSAPAFDVTSVKPNTGTQDFVRFDPQPGGRLSITNASLRMVVSWAYGVQNTQLQGGPDWFDSARFDFLAKAEGNPTTEEMRLMLRTMLVDRFQLKFHSETREIPVCALTRPRPDAKLGPKLSSSDSNCGALPDGKPRRCEFDVRFGNIPWPRDASGTAQYVTRWLQRSSGGRSDRRDRTRGFRSDLDASSRRRSVAVYSDRGAIGPETGTNQGPRRNNGDRRSR